MIVELIVPSLGESISEVEIGAWRKQVGEPVGRDEAVVEIESEKATVELPAPQAGVLRAVHKQTGEAARVGEVIGQIDTSQVASAEPAAPAAAAESSDDSEAAQEPVSQAPTEPGAAPEQYRPAADATRVMPAARRLLEQSGLGPDQVEATGPGGRLLKEDVQRAARRAVDQGPAAAPADAWATAQAVAPTPAAEERPTWGLREERVVRMSMMRRTIAARLIEAQQTAALLTTFNEIDMSQVIALRREFGEEFRQRHEIKLGFTSFFVRATVVALAEFPELNAEIRGEEVVYRSYCDVGIAVGSGKGLVVPVLRNAERMSFAEIERAVAGFAQRAKAGTLSMEELRGLIAPDDSGFGSSLLSALFDALDAEIARWELRSREDPNARSVLRAFLGVREILWEISARGGEAEASSEESRTEGGETGPSAGPVRSRRSTRVQRVRVEG